MVIPPHTDKHISRMGLAQRCCGISGSHGSTSLLADAMRRGWGTPVEGLCVGMFWCEHTQTCFRRKLSRMWCSLSGLSDESLSLLVAKWSVVPREAPWP